METNISTFKVPNHLKYQKTMDDYLNEVDYTFTNYMPSDEALAFINFIKEVNNGEEENETPLVHLVMLDNMLNGKRRCIFVCHRGMGKSTLCEYLILFNAAFGYFPGFGKVNFMIYVSDSIENGVKTLRKNIQHKYENSKFLQKLIPNKRLTLGSENGGYVSEEEWDNNKGGRKFTDVRLEFENVNGDKLVVRGFGVLTGIRGARELNSRPQVAILDDLLSDEDARSDTVINAVENVVYKAVAKALHPQRQKIIWVGTPFNAKDPLYKAVESGSWNVTVLPICEKFPCSKEEFRGSWEDRFPYEYVKTEYDEAMALKRPEFFNQELMLRVTNLEDRLVKDDDIVWFKEDSIKDKKRNFNYYITTDLATTIKEHSDFSVITVWAVNSNEDYMIVDAFCGRIETSEFIDKLFNYNLKYRPLSIGIEVTGQQAGFISLIREEMNRRNNYFNFASSNNKGDSGIRPIKDKFSRFLLFTPKFKNKKIWINERLRNGIWGKEFTDEISKATQQGFKSRHDDVLDTISMMSDMQVYVPSYDSYKEDDSWFDDDELEGFNNTIF